MPQVCCAFNCGHTSIQCKLKRFPTDAHRAAIWEANIQRADWVRKPWHKLCECHFDEDQWERKRLDGLRKLTPNAVPKLFGQRRVGSAKKKTQEKQLCVGGSSSSSGDPFPVKAHSTSSNLFQVGTTIKCDTSKELQSLQQEVAVLKEENKVLRSAMAIFEEEQLDILMGKNVTSWTPKTIKKNIELRLAVGNSGYDYLIEQGWPLPAAEVLEKYWTESGCQSIFP